MKKASILLPLSALLFAPSVLANTEGSVPSCTSGAVNVEVYNKNLLSTACSGGKGKYCIYYPLFESSEDAPCVDESAILTENSNESYSLAHANKKLSVKSYLGTKDGASMANLEFRYDNGSFTNNCADVFGSDVQCIVTKSGSSNHRLYKVTIVRNR